MNAVNNSLGNLITKLAIYPISFISSVVVARVLGPEDRGIYSYLLLLISFLLPIFSLGIGGGITYYVSSNQYTPKNVSYSVFLIGFFIGLILITMIILLRHTNMLGSVGNNIEIFELVMMLGSVFLNSIFFMLSRILFGDSKFSFLNWISIVQGVLNPFLLLMLVWLLNIKLHGASLTLFIINFINTCIIIIYICKKYDPVISINYQFLKLCAKYGYKGWLGDMAIKANVRLDQIILGSIAKPAVLGVYSISVLLVELLWILPDAIGPVLFNKIAQQKNDHEKVEISYKINRILLTVTLLISIVLFFVTLYLLIPYGYGNEYKEAIIPFVILIPGSIIYITAKVVTKTLSGSGLIAATSKATILGSLISIVLYIVLIPLYGMIGAAIASSIGYIAISIACLYQFKRNFSFSVKPFFTFNKKDIKWALSVIKNR